MRSFLATLATALILFAPACTRHWNLKVTEVGKRRVEVYLDQPTTDNFSLRGMKLIWSGNGIPGDRLDLGALARPLTGGEFLVIWEEGNYTGPPVAAAFTQGQLASVPGIKVAAGYFNGIDSVPAEVRVEGARSEAIFVVHKATDVVRFGLPAADRPATGGSFTPNDTLLSPSGSGGPQRKWGATGPMDTNAESDWVIRTASWGLATR